ncbi:unnamed protein product [marine sediment metagenome]|uniref:DUF721 domain-containing protein n=1 Tax=marine sediment metagenome TaxID=412755 RepID=X0TWH2_9ZZZZ
MHVYGDDSERPRRYEPQRMADVVAGLMARRGYGRLQAAAVADEAWGEALGEKLARHTRPGAVKRGVLEVLVRNSAVMQELTFQKKKLIKKLLQLLPNEKIKDIKFRVGSVD